MPLIDRVKEHYRVGLQKVEVPEWGEEGRPLVVYYHPITLAERQKFMEISERDGQVAAWADVLITKALDEHGKKLFTLDDKQVLRHHANPDVIRRLGLQLMLAPSVDDMGKDLSRTPTSS